MAWTNDSKIRDLEPYAEKHDFQQVVIIAIRPDDKFEVISYGRNKKLCDSAKEVADEIYDLVISGEIKIEPVESEAE